MNVGRKYIYRWLVGCGTCLALAACGPCPVEDDPGGAAAPTPVPAGETEPAAPPIRLQPASGSGVLILEEDTEAAWQQEPAPEDEDLSGRPAPPLPPGHQGFRDHHVTIYVSDTAAGLEDALRAATAAGGQLITHPISGFENLGPNERTLVFDARTYPVFLQRLESQGEAEYSEIGPSDFVTVRLTVIEKK
jgi:hypothetical protein